MRDDDTLILESLYLQIIEENAESNKAQALNLFIRLEVGQDVFKKKNKPENKEVIDAARTKWNPTIESLEQIIISHNPKDKNLTDITPLANFFLEIKNIELLDKEYKDYRSHPNLVQKNIIQSAPNFQKC